MKRERWKDIPGFLGYQVSNLGRVRSFLKLRREVRSYVGTTSKIVIGSIDAYGYRKVELATGVNGKRKCVTKKVHQLVLAAFVGAVPKGKIVRHLNSRKLDCRLRNLRYGTHKENAHDKIANGTYKYVGEENPFSRLRNSDIVKIRTLCKRLVGRGCHRPENKRGKLRCADIGRMFGVTASSVSLINRRKTWTHVK